ncbi:MAG: anaerobic ribonucleoside-triphosphate reductase activating protein [Oscillospiraceae bacterium]|jgi:anaerobic ribonucleoside-triphosphate reductase activating protein|nr:anaerobic ribonucleoside-triphosphate reductase activating protein [Oscillospiraceae bacterium]
MMEQQVKIAGILSESIVDGPGIRMVVFFQGCPHGCEGCHNPKTHDFKGGKYKSIDNIIKKIRENPLLSGVTISGGEPFCQPKELLELVKRIKQEKKGIIIYSGYKIEELLQMESTIKEILQNTDYLIDGKFDIAKRDLLLKFRGSSNQRVIDCRKTLEEGKIAEHEF